MQFGTTTLSIVPIRKEADHRSEMTSQLLFGDLFRILETKDDWLSIALAWDGYEGWVHSTQILQIEEKEYLRLLDADTPASMDLVQLIANETSKSISAIALGSSLPGIEGQFFSIAGAQFQFEGQVSDTELIEEARTQEEKMEFCHALVDDAMMYLNTPYLWGGRTPFGIDCSGLVQMAYRLKQIKLPRDAADQATQGEVVSLLDEALPGDLVFFDDEEGNIVHVGILADRSKALHASGYVRVDAIDHQGIYDGIREKYTHKLRLIKRIV
jgi:gamma-D-glutamyl-L-lysine dipeptidyl-peptidase